MALPSPLADVAPNTGLPLSEQRTRFDLDFPGGTPRELARAIEAGRHKPLNLLVPEEAEGGVQIPAMKMTHVDLPDLFKALSSTSMKTESYVVESGGRRGYEQYQTGYTIQAQGPITDDTVWCFVYQGRTPPPVLPEKKTCRFFNLAPYLEDPSRNLKVEDITTAIETGWKMLGETSIPAVSFHKDTKLLIAVGESAKLEMIDMVLKELGQGQRDSFERKLQEIRQKAGMTTPTPPPPPAQAR